MYISSNFKFMYISSNFKCQLKLNWHLNLDILVKVCITQSWYYKCIFIVGSLGYNYINLSVQGILKQILILYIEFSFEQFYMVVKFSIVHFLYEDWRASLKMSSGQQFYTSKKLQKLEFNSWFKIYTLDTTDTGSLNFYKNETWLK
jgi:hypothetical protein